MKSNTKNEAGAVESCANLAHSQELAPRCGPNPPFDAQGGFSTAPAPITFEVLIAAYKADPISNYRKARYCTRRHYDTLCRRLVSDIGHLPLASFRYRDIVAHHGRWTTESGVSMAHALIGMVRTVVNFGLVMLEDPECQRLALVLHQTKFKMAPPRTERLTAEQAEDIREYASRPGLRLRSIALAQAIQFEAILRQRDVIGEWVPLDEPGDSDVIDHTRGLKWLRGLRWEEIDSNFVLRHVTSKRQKPVTVDLRLAPMVMLQFGIMYGKPRSLPQHGPVIISERSGLPWHASEFRRKWREIADECGVPKSVKNMDSRSGAISEATDAGVDLEHIRHAATHSDIKMTMRYSRGAEEKTANVQRIRAEFRANKEEAA